MRCFAPLIASSIAGNAAVPSVWTMYESPEVSGRAKQARQVFGELGVGRRQFRPDAQRFLILGDQQSARDHQQRDDDPDNQVARFRKAHVIGSCTDRAG